MNFDPLCFPFNLSLVVFLLHLCDCLPICFLFFITGGPNFLFPPILMVCDMIRWHCGSGKHTEMVCERGSCVHGRLLIYPQISANLITAGLNVIRLIFTCVSQDLEDLQVLR